MRLRSPETIERWSGVLQVLGGSVTGVLLSDLQVDGVPRSTVMAWVDAMERAGFVVRQAAPDGARNAACYHLSPEGRAAWKVWRSAKEAREHADRLALPNRQNLFELPVYQPAPDRAFYRNNGNKHLKSLGF